MVLLPVWLSYVLEGGREMALFGSARILIKGEQEKLDGALALLRRFPRLNICDVNTSEKKNNPYTSFKEEAFSLAKAICAFDEKGDKKRKKAQGVSADNEAGAERAAAYLRWISITQAEHEELTGEKASLEKMITECLSAQKVLSGFQKRNLILKDTRRRVPLLCI